MSENETLMTEQAATTTEGEAASQVEGSSTAEQAENQTEVEQEVEQQTESQADEESEGQVDEQAEDDSQKVPESYEFEAPEGMELDESLIGELSEVSKDLGLTQEQAQTLLDRMGPAMAQRQAEQIEALHQQWAEEAKADKEFGGDKLNDSLSHAKRAMDQFATDDLKSLLNETGMGNHPEVVRFFVRVGKATSEDGFVSGRKGAVGRKPFYPNSDMK